MPYFTVGQDTSPADIHFTVFEPKQPNEENSGEAIAVKGNVLCLMGFMAEGYAWEPQVTHNYTHTHNQ